jgi:site-specific DNA-methyltransferase (adenine-specific)
MIPELTESEYECLKAAIRSAGQIHVPVVRTADGEILDGRGRVRAAQELGIANYPLTVIDGLDAEARRLHRVMLNCARRHLTTAQKREVIRATLLASHDLSNNYLSEIVGVDDKTVAAVRREMEQTSEIPTHTHFRGKDGKLRPRSVLATTTRQADEAAEALTKLGEAAPKRLLTAREATRRAAKAQPKATARVEKAVGDPLVAVHNCDFRDMPVEDGSASLVFVDPLYHREHLGLYSGLGEWAARVLKPGSLLVTYLGTSYLPEVMYRLGRHLTYVWQCVTVFSGQKTSIHDRQIRTGYKPLLVYSNGPARPRKWLIDVIETPMEKGSHPYQQPEAEAAYFIERLTEPGDLVVDPFCGSGTTAAVCRRTKRRCLTADVDANAVAIARERVASEGRRQESEEALAAVLGEPWLDVVLAGLAA